jgi:hypothetical protein
MKTVCIEVASEIKKKTLTSDWTAVESVVYRNTVRGSSSAAKRAALILQDEK